MVSEQCIVLTILFSIHCAQGILHKPRNGPVDYKSYLELDTAPLKLHVNYRYASKVDLDKTLLLIYTIIVRTYCRIGLCTLMEEQKKLASAEN